MFNQRPSAETLVRRSTALATAACLVFAGHGAVFWAIATYFVVCVIAAETLLGGKSAGQIVFAIMTGGFDIVNAYERCGFLVLSIVFLESWIAHTREATDYITAIVALWNVTAPTRSKSRWLPLAVMFCYFNGSSHVDLMRLVVCASVDRMLARDVIVEICRYFNGSADTVRPYVHIAAYVIGALRYAVFQAAVQAHTPDSPHALTEASILNVCAVVLSVLSIVDGYLNQVSAFSSRNMHHDCAQWLYKTLVSACACARRAAVACIRGCHRGAVEEEMSPSGTSVHIVRHHVRARASRTSCPGAPHTAVRDDDDASADDTDQDDVDRDDSADDTDSARDDSVDRDDSDRGDVDQGDVDRDDVDRDDCADDTDSARDDPNSARDDVDRDGADRADSNAGLDQDNADADAASDIYE